MAFQTTNNHDGEVMSEINMTPLVDVMLVLLIIFIVAMPIMQHSVKINLPQATAQAKEASTQDVNIVIDAQGLVTWDGAAVDALALQKVAVDTASNGKEVVLHVSADKLTAYEHVAKVMAVIQNAGLSKVGLVTTPQ